MLTRVCVCLTACAMSGWFVGCSFHHPHAAAAPPAATAATGKHDMEDPPHARMTKDEVLAKYGEPFRRTYTEDGEQWLYRLNFRDASLHSLNPFDVSQRTVVRYGTILFSAQGRVKRFRWDAGEGSGNG